MSIESLRPEVFREAAGSACRLSLHDLLRLHGQASGAVLLLVLSVLCVIPVYGVGTALSLAILLMAWHWRRLIAEGDGASASLLPRRLSHRTCSWSWRKPPGDGLAACGPDPVPLKALRAQPRARSSACRSSSVL